MGKGYKHGGSGGANPLNFIVKAYPSEVELNNATAVANTIGVVTTNPITGWYFDTEQPQDMKEGEVWFLDGKSSSAKFNALKANNISVYPSGAKQMVSGDLRDVTAKTYQDGKWVDWWIFLYDKGNEFEARTGGWNLVKEGSGGSLANVGNELTLTAGGASNGVAAFTNNKIDLTNIKNIYFNISTRTFSGGNNYCHLFVTNAGNSAWTHTNSPAATKDPGNSATGEFSIDVSNLSGEYYIAFNYFGGNAQKIGCDVIRME